MVQNIIFYFSDQQRYDTANSEIMPNLMELAEDGTFFENCYTCQPVCGPARACLQTGVYPTECGCHINGIPLKDDTKSLADFFNENGYQPFYTEIRVQPKNNDFSDIYVKIKSKHYMLLYLRNFIHSHTLILEELSYVCCEYMNLLEKSYKQ